MPKLRNRRATVFSWRGFVLTIRFCAKYAETRVHGLAAQCSGAASSAYRAQQLGQQRHPWSRAALADVVRFCAGCRGLSRAHTCMEPEVTSPCLTGQQPAAREGQQANSPVPMADAAPCPHPAPLGSRLWTRRQGVPASASLMKRRCWQTIGTTSLTQVCGQAGLARRISERAASSVPRPRARSDRVGAALQSQSQTREHTTIWSTIEGDTSAF